MTSLLATLAVMFAASTAALLISRKLDQPVIPFYILSGILISALISQAQVLNLSQLGISFLVFIYGVRFSTEKLRTVASEGLTSSIVSIMLTGLAATLLAYLIGLNLIETIVLASAASLSSSLVGLELVKDDLRKELVHGRLIESIQLIQDLVAILIILTIFSHSPVSAVFKGFVILLSAFTVKESIPYLAEGFRESTEAIMVFSLAILAIFVSLSRFFDISMVLGAFAAGISLSKYPYSLEVIDTVGSLKDFFTAVLFVSIGSLAATISVEVVLLSFGIVLLTLIVKPVIIYLSLKAFGWDTRISFLSSLGLDQVSEFSVIIAIQAFLLGSIGEPLLQSVILATAFTMALSSYTNKYEHYLYEKFSEITGAQEKIESTVENPENHVILVGYDTQGRQILEDLSDRQVVIIEYDPEKIQEIDEKDAEYVFGDVMHRSAWEKANYKKADMIISTVPLRHVSDRIMELDTEADKILRSPDVQQAEQLLREGATFVSVPKILASQRMSEHLEGVIDNPEYREELRRKNLLELRKQQGQ